MAAAAELLYVSWGGTGRAASLREALAEAKRTERGLVYLAVLDDSTFADIDNATMELAKDELSWLLNAQLELTSTQVGAEDIDVRVIVRSGDVADAVADVVDALGRTKVLIGAPVPVSGHESISELVDLLGSRIDVPVELVEPGSS